MTTLPDTLALPTRTISGAGAIGSLLAECAIFGARGMLVHGRSLETHGVLRSIVDGKPGGMIVLPFLHPGGEPTLSQVAALLDAARKARVDWIAAVGGGSVIDVAKTAAGLLEAPLAPLAYHDGADIPPGRIPFVATPTTAGTGSEATTVCVLTNERTGVKKSIRHPTFMARVVVLDPDLLATCPPSVVASSGMDAFAQAIESYASRHATWLTEELSLKAVALISACLEPVYRGRKEQRAGLLEGSYLAGLALSNARLGVVHGLAHPLGARFHQPHGLVCAVCLPPALEFNRAAIGNKYDRMGEAAGTDICAKTDTLIAALGIQSPFTGRRLPDRQAVIEETVASGSTKANPRPVSERDVEWFLDKLFVPSFKDPGIERRKP